MEQNERKNVIPLYIEPEAVEDLPLSQAEKIREKTRNLHERLRRIRFPKIGMILTAAAAVLVLLMLIAAPLLPVLAIIIMFSRCFRPAFRARTA